MRIIRIKIILLKVGVAVATSKRTELWPPLCELEKESEFKSKRNQTISQRRAKEL